MKAGQKVECPACFYRFTVPENFVDDSPVQKKTQSVAVSDENYYRKKSKSVQHDVFLKEGDLVDKTSTRRAFEPVRGWQYVTLIIGLCVGLGAWAFIKVEEAMRSTFLSFMDIDEQRMLAGFFGLLAGVLIWVAARRQLWWGRFLALLIAVGLPLSVTEREIPTEGENSGKVRPIIQLSEEPELTADQAPVPANVDDYREGDLDPLFEDINEMGARNVLGVWVRGLNSSNAPELTSYIRRMSKIRDTPRLYSRNSGGLYILNGAPLSFREFIQMLAPLGTVNLSDEQSRFVDLQLKPDLIEEVPSVVMLQDPSNKYFIEANYKELLALDMRRIEAAARRLAKEPPRDEKRKEIVDQLEKLIGEPWGFDSDYITALGAALSVWAEPDNKTALESVAYVVEKLGEAKKDIPNELVAYLVNGRFAGTAVALMPAWEHDPFRWEDSLISYGSLSENSVLPLLNSEGLSREARASALRILEKVGTEKSLPVLRPLMEQKDNVELSNLSTAAIRSIESRMPKTEPEAPQEEGKE